MFSVPLSLTHYILVEEERHTQWLSFKENKGRHACSFFSPFSWEHMHLSLYTEYICHQLSDIPSLRIQCHLWLRQSNWLSHWTLCSKRWYFDLVCLTLRSLFISSLQTVKPEQGWKGGKYSLLLHISWIPIHRPASINLQWAMRLLLDWTP